MKTELLMYSRTMGCPFVNIAKALLASAAIPYQEIFIDQDPAARERVIRWTGFQSVPTLIIAPAGEFEPIEAPSYLAPGASPRGIDRGAMITEPSRQELIVWLQKHGLLEHVPLEP